MSERILCPYCGPWNKHPDGVEMVDEGNEYADPRSLGLPLLYWYRCPCCNSQAPSGRNRKEARKNALRRFTPTRAQVPLTLDEIRAMKTPWPVWLELLHPNHLRPVILSSYDAKRDLLTTSDTVLRNTGAYNTTWRLWSTKPTDCDRKAARWEEKAE